MIRNILLPLDGTVESEAVLPIAQRMADPGDHVHLLHVLSPVPSAMGPGPVILQHDQASAYLEKVREQWFAGRRGSDLVTSAEPAPAILLHALEKNIDLIAMATHGRRGLAKLLLGSVAEAVIRQAQLPVLLVRPGMPACERPVRRILMAVEGRELPKDLLESVKSLTTGTNAEIILFHASPPVADPAPLWASPLSLATRSRPEHYLQELADRLGEQGYAAWPLAVKGEPVEAILEHSRKQDVDLIALSTHGRTGMERLVAGSVAEAVLRSSTVPVLLQKPLVVHKPALAGEPSGS